MDGTGTATIFVIRSSSRISPGRRTTDGESYDDRGEDDDGMIDRGGGGGEIEERPERPDRGGPLVVDGDGGCASSLGEELTSGMAVVRDLTAFGNFDAELRGELRRRGQHLGKIPALPLPPTDGVVRGGGGGGGGGDATTVTENHNNLRSHLAEYLSSLLGIPDVVGSDAIARFLERDRDRELEEWRRARSEEVEGRSIPEPAGEESPPTFDGRNFADYIFQGVDVDETSTISIPRREFFHHKEESLPPGWWIVWQYRVETSGPPVEFGVFLQNDCDEGGAEDSSSPEGDDGGSEEEDVTSSPSWTCVVRESVGQTSDVVRGSYRCEPSYHEDDDSTTTDGTSSVVRCVLRFSNTASILRGARLQLAVRCVPHEAFRAACEAAEDQSRADERRRRSPLLRHILEDSSLEHPVRLVVEALSSSSPSRPSPEGEVQSLTTDPVEEGCHDHPPSTIGGAGAGGGTAHPSAVAPSPSSPGDAPGPHPSVSSSSSDAAEPERDDDGEGEGGDDYDALLAGVGVSEEVLAAMRAEIETLRSDVEFLNAERREWSITENEMREELSISKKLLEEERGRTSRLDEELEEKTREIMELTSEVDFLKGRIPTDAEVERAEGDLRDARSETRRAHDMIDLLRGQLSELKRENETLSAELRKHRDAASDALLNATAEADEARMMQRILEGKVREMERLLVTRRSGASIAAGVVATVRDGGNGNGSRKRGGNGVIVAEATNGTNGRGDFAAAAAQSSTREGNGVSSEESLSGSKNDDDAGSRRHDRQGSSTTVERRPFVHPDPRINAQLVGLQERHGKLLAMSRSNPEDGRRNAELIGKIEDAIEAIISSASAGDVG